ncbi:hypothetical protein JNUCC83_05250 [Vagococcus sp. JNUCC 83]
MKKAYLFVILSVVVLLVGCTNKATGDKAVYGEVKKALLAKINSFDDEKQKEVKEEYGLDKKTLDELPLAIYNVDGRYVGVIEPSSDDKEYFYYSVKRKKVITKLDEQIGSIDFEHLTPVYSQNDFK